MPARGNARRVRRMPLKVQRSVLAVMARSGVGEVQQVGGTPTWLNRPGPDDCGEMWSAVCDIYRALTGQQLPSAMPERERRAIDAVLVGADGRRIVEVDESQHFTPPRAQTLAVYPGGVLTAFDRERWEERSLRGRLPQGGFARPCPPLFPGPGGRHLQRAFRDALADLLPAVHGWLPTLRIADWEVKQWIDLPDAQDRMDQLIAAKLKG